MRIFATSSSENTRSPQIFLSLPAKSIFGMGRASALAEGINVAKWCPLFLISTDSPSEIQEAMSRKLFRKSAMLAVFMIEINTIQWLLVKPKFSNPTETVPLRGAQWSRLGLVAGHKTPKTTPDAPPIPDRQAQPRGVDGGESGGVVSEDE